MIDKQQAASIESRLKAVEASLAAPEAAAGQRRYRELVREHASLRKLSGLVSAYLKLVASIEDAKRIADDPDADDDFRELARAEMDEAEAALPKAERDLRLALMPPDPDARRNAMVEIRAGTGGDEAAIFAGDLYRMYSRHAEARGWKITPMDASPGEKGGYKEIVFLVEGEGAFVTLRYEGGVHRVQRVPETETQGRIHTSAATVAVFPQADEEDELVIDPQDLRIDFFRSGGAGGQHVNKTDSAVRITHLPTGIVVQSQEERSQHQNRDKCMAALRSRLLDRRMAAEEAEMGSARRIMIGGGDRSEKIRTYNFPQNRLTDHRIGLTLYSLDRIVLGDLDDLLEALALSNEEMRMSSQIGRVAGAAAADSKE
ncbi:MAG: peptide chain release factor 1 [Kiritimatiellia bacterium]|jgi:peptide chain release factor 1